MTIQYCSDLHLDFSLNKKFIAKCPITLKGEVLLVAGDIVPFAVMDDHNDFFDYLDDNFEQTYWVPGNREYYHTDISNKSFTIKEAKRTNVFLVNNIEVQW